MLGTGAMVKRTFGSPPKFLSQQQSFYSTNRIASVGEIDFGDPLLLLSFCKLVIRCHQQKAFKSSMATDLMCSLALMFLSFITHVGRQLDFCGIRVHAISMVSVSSRIVDFS